MPALKSIFLLCFLLSQGVPAQSSEIVNGEKVPAKVMPYMVSVQDDKKHVCGGFLVSEEFVMTAAHCVKGNSIRVALGSHNLKKVENSMRIKATPCPSANFTEISTGNDIMLLKLSEKVKFTSTVQRIRLPKGPLNIKDNSKCQVAGWGKTHTKGNTVDDLKMAVVTTINKAQCSRTWKLVQLPQNIICAGGYKTNKGFCQGDSGGPLIWKGMAIGVVSFNYGHNCDYPNRPNVYTDISKYSEWYQKVLQRKKC